ncbi:MAG: phosphatase PAP2 family protein [Planctomycetota bacterium]
MKSATTPLALRRWHFTVAIFFLLLALFLDGWILSRMPPEGTQFGDLYHLLRSLGYLPTWISFALIYTLAATNEQRISRRSGAISIVFTAAGSGIVAAILKVMIRRLDPQTGYEGDWNFAPWDGNWWDGTDLCFPSEHAAVAWGAAIAISRRWPGSAPLMLLLAAGCACGRVLARGHNPSDVVASLLLALIVSHWIDRCPTPQVS